VLKCAHGARLKLFGFCQYMYVYYMHLYVYYMYTIYYVYYMYTILPVHVCILYVFVCILYMGRPKKQPVKASALKNVVSGVFADGTIFVD